jgi:DNA primase
LPLLKVGRTFRFAFLQAGKDPDELVRTRGLDAFKDALLGSESLWDVLWERETERSISNARFDTPDKRAALEQRMYSIVRTIRDQAVQTAYYRTCRIDLSDLFWQATRANRELSGTSRRGLVKTELRIEKEGHRHGLQKILLGMLVHYPEFLDEKAEQLERVKFASDLEKFRTALHMLLIDLGELSVELIYERLPPNFYQTLNDVHGKRTDKKPWGHALFRRFPILERDPPHDFVARCVDHFVHVLQIEQMADELRVLRAGVGPDDPDIEQVLERITALKRNLQEHIVHRDIQEIALAEEAAEMRRLGRTPESPWPQLERAEEPALSAGI